MNTHTHGDCGKTLASLRCALINGHIEWNIKVSCQCGFNVFVSLFAYDSKQFYVKNFAFAWLVIAFLPHTHQGLLQYKKCQIMKKNVIYVQKEMLFIVYNHVNRADTHALLIVIRVTMQLYDINGITLIMREQTYVFLLLVLLRFSGGCDVAWANDSSFLRSLKQSKRSYIAYDGLIAPSNFDGANVMALWMEIYVLEFTPQLVNFLLYNRCSDERCGVVSFAWCNIVSWGWIYGNFFWICVVVNFITEYHK